MKIILSDRLGNKKKAMVEGHDNLVFIWEEAYSFEDILTFEVEANSFVGITIDQHLKSSIIYTPSGIIIYQIPVGFKTKAYHPDAFQQNHQEIRISTVSGDVLKCRRNLAMNSLDKRWATGYYPHAEANVVTRDEPGLKARTPSMVILL